MNCLRLFRLPAGALFAKSMEFSIFVPINSDFNGMQTDDYYPSYLDLRR